MRSGFPTAEVSPIFQVFLVYLLHLNIASIKVPPGLKQVKGDCHRQLYPKQFSVITLGFPHIFGIFNATSPQKTLAVDFFRSLGQMSFGVVLVAELGRGAAVGFLVMDLCQVACGVVVVVVAVGAIGALGSGDAARRHRGRSGY